MKRLTATVSAIVVAAWQIAPAYAAHNEPATSAQMPFSILSAVGTDTNVNLQISAQGSGVLLATSDAYFSGNLTVDGHKAIGFNGVSNNITETFTSANLLDTNMAGAHFTVDLAAAIHANNTSGSPGVNTLAATVFSGNVTVQMLCFNGTDACRSQVTNGPASVLQDMTSNGIVFDEVAVANGVNHVRVTNAATGGASILSAVGTDTNVNLQISAQGSGVLLATSDANFSGNLQLQATKFVSFNGFYNNITESFTSANVLDINMNGAHFTVDLGAAIHTNNTSGSSGVNTLAATVFSGNVTVAPASSPPSGTKGGNLCYDTNKVIYGC